VVSAASVCPYFSRQDMKAMRHFHYE